MTANDALDLEKLAAQEQILIFDSFDEDTALQLGLLIRERADEMGPVIVDIRSAANDPLFFAAMPGTSPANVDWARRKRNLVNLLQTSSYGIGLRAKAGSDIVAMMALDPRDHTPHGGCVPIRVKGAGMVATVTVSGLPQRDDHKLATDCMAELLGIDLGDNGF
ncbi:MAG: hypothetical protein RJA35_1452 [Actinomycetota bacterium]|jgi:uncharacterized protein (UPF0303 family)